MFVCAADICIRVSNHGNLWASYYYSPLSLHSLLAYDLYSYLLSSACRERHISGLQLPGNTPKTPTAQMNAEFAYVRECVCVCVWDCVLQACASTMRCTGGSHTSVMWQVRHIICAFATHLKSWQRRRHVALPLLKASDCKQRLLWQPCLIKMRIALITSIC